MSAKSKYPKRPTGMCEDCWRNTVENLKFGLSTYIGTNCDCAAKSGIDGILVVKGGQANTAAHIQAVMDMLGIKPPKALRKS